MSGRPRGFTLVEALVTLVLTGLVIAGLQTLLLQQRRVGERHRARTALHDATRIVDVLLGGELREAIPGEGDVVIDAGRELRVRSPRALAVVCGVDVRTGVVALDHLHGEIGGEEGDSLLVYTSGPWGLAAVDASGGTGGRGPTCALHDDDPEALVRLERALAERVPVGAPVRFFRSRRYRLAPDAGSWWLMRSDTEGDAVLAGPLAPDGLRFAFLDAEGGSTRDPERARAVRIGLVMPTSLHGPGRGRDSTSVTIHARNR